MRALHAIVAVIFLLIAAIQLNDPDPVYWVTVYALVAAVPGARLFGRRLGRASLVIVGMVLAGILMSIPGFIDYVVSGDYAGIGGSMAEDKPYIESAREFLGLLIAALCLFCYRDSATALSKM